MQINAQIVENLRCWINVNESAKLRAKRARRANVP